MSQRGNTVGQSPDEPGLLNLPTSVLFRLGSDGRSQEEKAGLNSYGVGPTARSAIPFGSCTASSPLPHLLSRCAEVHRKLQQKVEFDALSEQIKEEYAVVRMRVRTHLQLDEALGAQLILTPSGTDGEYLAMLLALGGASERLLNIVVGPREVGGGTEEAAGGHYFNHLTPSGKFVQVGAPVVPALSKRVDVRSIGLRGGNGELRAPEDLDEEVIRVVDAAIAQGMLCLLHIVAHSKTGAHAPSLSAVREIARKYGSRVRVVVDAAQGRISRQGLRLALDSGYIVLLTGSKFYGGPPFSGALIVPKQFDEIIDNSPTIPEEFGEFFSRWEFPERYQEWATRLGRAFNIGLLLRWIAAEEAMRSYYDVPGEVRFSVLRRFEAEVPKLFKECSWLKLDSVEPVFFPEGEERLLESKTTVFPFRILRDHLRPEAGYLLNDELRLVHRLLNEPIDPKIISRALLSNFEDAEFQSHLGQPVFAGSPERAAVLRIALGAALVWEVGAGECLDGDLSARLDWLSLQITRTMRKLGWIAENFSALKSALLFQAASARIEIADAHDAVSDATDRGLLSGPDPAAILYDLDFLRARFKEIVAAFPVGSLHAVAIKANPLIPVLRRLVSEGAGLEAASIEEVAIALSAGCAPERIVFDSPAKTVADLAFCLERGISLNLDNFEELERVARLLEGSSCRSRIGLRINPCVDDGNIEQTSVGSVRSRFGVPILGCSEEILQRFQRYPWLDGVHCHVGSQGCSLALLLSAARVMVHLVEKIESTCGFRRISFVDLGGGVPADYGSGAPSFTVQEYARALESELPEDFFRSRQLITEFGRIVNAGAAFAFSEIEYVKTVEGRRTVVIHLGADFMLRTAYSPQLWPHEIVGIPRGQSTETEETIVSDVVGPLCFAGDVLAQAIPLPSLKQGDWLLIRDVGAYTLSMWSRHCSRAMPLVLGFWRTESGGREWAVLRPRETTDAMVKFWGG